MVGRGYHTPESRRTAGDPESLLLPINSLTAKVAKAAKENHRQAFTLRPWRPLRFKTERVANSLEPCWWQPKQFRRRFAEHRDALVVSESRRVQYVPDSVGLPRDRM